MDKEEFRFWKMEQKWRSLPDKPLFKLSEDTQEHHDEGRKNSDLTTRIATNRHEFINRRITILSKRLRKIPSLSSLTNAIGAIDLLGYELRHILFLIKDDPSFERLEQACLARGYSYNQVTAIVRCILEAYHDKRTYVYTNLHQKSRPRTKSKKAPPLQKI